MKTKILLLSILTSTFLFAQKQSSFVKLKQEKNEKQFCSFILNNPALQSYSGSNRVSALSVFQERNKNDSHLIQTPKEYLKFGCTTSSFYPMSKSKLVWGSASYTNIDIKDIKWNETSDYEINYPYFTADSVGGSMDVEEYTFNGGLSKKYSRVDFGLSINYKGSLSYRNVDPRPKNLSSDLYVKAGLNFKDLKGINFSLYSKVQRYIQSNDIAFHNRKGVSSIYHLNGLGYFNYVLKSSKWKCYYSGYGFGAGTTVHFPNKKVFFTIDYDALTIEKWIKDSNIPTASTLSNHNIDVNLAKFFISNVNNFALKLNYKKELKLGIEPTFSITNSYINTLKTEENFNFHKTNYGLSALYFTESERSFFKLEPYVDYQRYREKYYLFKSFQFFDKLNFGAKYNYIYKMKNDVFSMFTDIYYSNILKNDSLLRDTPSESSISKMLINNSVLLSKNVFNTSVNLQYTHPLKSKLNLFYAVKTDATVLGSKLNIMYNFSTGIIF